MMIDTDANQYYWWWTTTDNDDWLRVSLIAAPIMVVVGVAALISYKLLNRRGKNIYRMCRHNRVIYDSVYKPTTYTMTKEDVCEVQPQDSSVLLSPTTVVNEDNAE